MKRSILVLSLLMALPLQALATGPSFPDVSKDHKNFYAIETLKAAGTLGGYPDGSFKPEGNINRAEFAKMLVFTITNGTPDSSKYKNCFPDVGTEWFAPYVCYAKEQGWIQGYPDSTFKPVQNVNRAEALKMLFESTEPGSADQLALSDDLFADVDPEAWFAKYVNLAQSVNITEEKDGNFNPANNATRGVIAEYLFRKMVVGYTQKPYDDIQMGAFLVGTNMTWLYSVGAYESPLEITDVVTEGTEYVEIKNIGSSSVNLNGYYLEGDNLLFENIIYTFGNVTLGGGDTLRVYSGSGTYHFSQGNDLWDETTDINLYDASGNLETYYGF